MPHFLHAQKGARVGPSCRRRRRTLPTPGLNAHEQSDAERKITFTWTGRTNTRQLCCTSNLQRCYAGLSGRAKIQLPAPDYSRKKEDVHQRSKPKQRKAKRSEPKQTEASRSKPNANPTQTRRKTKANQSKHKKHTTPKANRNHVNSPGKQNKTKQQQQQQQQQQNKKRQPRCNCLYSPPRVFCSPGATRTLQEGRLPQRSPAR